MSSSRISGFYRLSPAQRRAAIAELCEIDLVDLSALDGGGLDLAGADGLIENVIGTYALPFALAVNFTIDGKDTVVPMVTEEPSVVAAASNAARMVRAGGGFVTRATEPVMIGQVQVCGVADPQTAAAGIRAAEAEILELARDHCPGVCERGGGPVGVEARVLSEPDTPDGGIVVAHILIDCRDAMGANIVNTVAEGVADRIAAIAQGRPGLRILSNLCRHRTVTVTAEVPDSALDPEAGASVREQIAAASRFAELDPYRAATHNKGIMNGVDAVVLATANDWRGTEAAAHAFAAQSGQYRPLAVWHSRTDRLVGEMTLPIAIGTVGGALQVHRAAQLAVRLCGAHTASQLARIVACAGLASNLAALRALATEGIQRGHMSLHARVIAQAAGATGPLIDRIATELVRCGDVCAARARQIMEEMGDQPPIQEGSG